MQESEHFPPGDSWANVPRLDPDNTRPLKRSDLPSNTKSLMARRSVLTVGLALGGAVALSILRWLPPARFTPVSAAVGTEYSHCAGYDNAPGYHDDSPVQLICFGADYGSHWCGSDGWFLISSGSGYNTYPVVVCGTGAYHNYKRNAWRWTYSGDTYRCADGVIVGPGADPVLKICSHEL